MATILSPPSTPSFRTRSSTYARTPRKSSPLTAMRDSSPATSPTSAVHDRRRSQYKTIGYNLPTVDRTRSASSRRHISSGAGRSLPVPRAELVPPVEEAPRKTFLRDRFKARCLERAQKDREQKIKGKRRASELSSDGPDDSMDWDDEDEEEDEESILDDELFQRIMASVNHKQRHSYRVSYAQDVGSSFDPDMEDAAEWERDLREVPTDDLPDEYDDDELAEYAAEQELLAGLTPEDIFTYSDIDDVPPLDADEECRSDSRGKGKGRALAFDDEDIEMDM